MNSPFTKILDGSDRTLVIAENAHFIAVLDAHPLVLGHTILISKLNEDDLMDLPDAALETLMPFAKQIAKAMKQAISCRKVGTAVIGLETRHAHLHLVPLQSANDLNFTREKLSPTPTELGTVLAKIKSAL